MQRYFAEFFGTALLVMVVVGSGIMGTNLSADAAIALLVNAISTGLALGLLIAWLAPISGAHLNPLVSWIMVIRKEFTVKSAFAYSIVQTLGAIAGALAANIMFDLAIFQTSVKVRASTGLWLSEVIATAGLVAVILVAINRSKQQLLPILVPVWIGSAYIFTASTSFANPAVTIGRIFSDTFAGISAGSVFGFILSQAAGAALGYLAASSLSKPKENHVQ